MGQRLHSATKYVIEYSNSTAFNYMSDKVNPIIEVLTEYDLGYQDDCLVCATTLWGNREKLIKNVDRIIAPDNEWEFQEELNDVINDLFKVYPDYTSEYIHSMLKKIINESDPSCQDVHFAWF